MVDLEGVLSDHTDRLALLQSRTQSDPRSRTAWKEYYAAIMEDEPRMVIMDMVHDLLAAGTRPLVYSTRFVNKHNHEEMWLRKHELWGHVDLIQRLPTQPKIKGPDLVAEWVQKFKPALIIDDRDEVRTTLQGLHLPEMKIYHYEDFHGAENKSKEVGST